MGKKIKLKGSSIWDKNKPINKKRKMKACVKSIDSYSKRKPINRSSKTKSMISKDNTSSYSNIYTRGSSSRYLPDIIERRYLFIIIVIILAFLTIGGRLVQLQVLMNDDYKEDLVAATERIVEGDSAPRGRIYDRNHKIIVDNEAVKTIYYKKGEGVTTRDELELSYTLSDMLDIDYSKLSLNMLKNYWYKSNKEEAESKITKEERQKYNERKLSSSDLEKLIMERITDEDLSVYDICMYYKLAIKVANDLRDFKLAKQLCYEALSKCDYCKLFYVQNIGH